MTAVTAAILIKGEKVLIARRKPGDRLAGKWEFPGGKVEEGEMPEQCLQREMWEEFQIDVTVGQYLGESTYRYEHGAVRLLVYRTYWNSGEMVPTVHDDVRWVDVKRLKDYDFAPADVPIVERLEKGELTL